MADTPNAPQPTATQSFDAQQMDNQALQQPGAGDSAAPPARADVNVTTSNVGTQDGPSLLNTTSDPVGNNQNLQGGPNAAANALGGNAALNGGNLAVTALAADAAAAGGAGAGGDGAGGQGTGGAGSATGGANAAAGLNAAMASAQAAVVITATAATGNGNGTGTGTVAATTVTAASTSPATVSNTTVPLVTGNGTITVLPTDPNQNNISSSDLVVTDKETNSPLVESGRLVNAQYDPATITDPNFGTFDIKADGNWSFTAVNALDYLADQQVLSRTFQLTATDGSVTNLTISIIGTNDAPTITAGTQSAQIVEAGGLNNAIPGNPDATIQLTKADVDGTVTYDATALSNGGWSTQDNGATYTHSGSFGSATLHTDTGAVDYHLDNTNPATQALAQGQTTSETFIVSVIDNIGATASRNIVFDIAGANDTAAITGTTTGGVIEAGGVANTTPGTPSATGTLESATSTFQVVDVPSASDNAYGTYTVDSAGNWSYTVDNTNGTVQGLNNGQSTTDTFSVVTVDGTTQQVTVTINGTNDAPTIAAETQSAQLVEAGGVNNSTSGNAQASIQLTPADVDGTTQYDATALTNGGWTPQDGGATYTQTGTYGTATLHTDTGVVDYQLDNTNPATQALAQGQTTSETFSVVVIDNNGATASQNVVFSITGASDTPALTATDSADSTNEDTALRGTITGDSTTSGGALTYAVVAENTVEHGSLVLNSNGTYTYTPNANYNGTDSFSYTVTDADSGESSVQTVSLTINAVNDPPILSDLTQPASVNEAVNASAQSFATTGSLSVSDADIGNTLTASVGSATVLLNGAAITDSVLQAKIDALTSGTPLTFDSAAISDGGSKTIGWHYAPGTVNVDWLKAGDHLTVAYNVSVSDGTVSTATQTLTFDIVGTNDAPTLSAGEPTYTLVEDGGVGNAEKGIGTASINLTKGDVDGTASYDTKYLTDNGWSTTNGGATYTHAGTYGTATLTIASNVVSYSLDNSKTVTQALTQDEPASDSFTVQVTDGSATASTNLVFNIIGTNDAAVISGTKTIPITETNEAQTVTGTLTSTDIDGVNNSFTEFTDVGGDGGYGSFSMKSDGVWSYTMSDAYDFLKSGDTLTDTLTVYAADGTPQLIKVIITGTNDAAKITGATTGIITESDIIQTVTGKLASTDVDGTDNLFKALSTTVGDHGYGSFTMNTAGKWTYTMKTAHDEFKDGVSYTDSVTVQADDGTPQTITVTITGTNDIAVIDGKKTGSITESDAVQTATGTLTSTDVDGTDNLFKALSTTVGDHGYGSFTMTTDGVWTYTMSDAHNEFKDGVSYTDSVTVYAADNTPQTITVTIIGTNDAAVIGGTKTGSVTEDGGNGYPGTPTSTGTLTDTDVDNTPNTFQAITAGTKSVSGYGTVAMDTAGKWTYTLDNSNKTVDALNTCSSLTDTFIAKTADGTEQTVTITIVGVTDKISTKGEKVYVDDTPNNSSYWSSDNSKLLLLNDSNYSGAAPTISGLNSGSTSMTYSVDGVSQLDNIIKASGTMNGTVSAGVGTATDNNDHIFFVLNDGTSMVGGSGSDAFVVTGGTGHTIYNLGIGTDAIVISGGSTSAKLAGDFMANSFSIHTGGTISINTNHFNLDLSAASNTTSAGFTITNSGAASTIVGSSGADTITGGTGNDVISGGAGNDSITGGSGVDTLTGGAGADLFKYTALTDLGTSPTSLETITDFSSADGDKLDMAALLSAATSYKNTMMLDSTSASASYSLVDFTKKVGSVNTDYLLSVHDSNALTGVGNHTLTELNSQLLLGNGTNSTNAAWTDIVDVKGTFHGAYATGSAPSFTDGWILKIDSTDTTNSAKIATINTQKDAAAGDIDLTATGYKKDAHVQIITADGTTHDISNVDKIHWHG